MFSNKSSIDKILKIHKRALQIVYDVDGESYENILNRSDNILIHQKHLRCLATEAYKSLTNISPGFMWNFFIIYGEVSCYFYLLVNLLAMVLVF